MICLFISSPPRLTKKRLYSLVRMVAKNMVVPQLHPDFALNNGQTVFTSHQSCFLFCLPWEMD